MAVAKKKIKWEDPPPSKGGHEGPVPHLPIATELKKHPGRWAYILTYPSRGAAGSMASYIKYGRSQAWTPAGAFESQSRAVDGQYRVYARYVGNE